MFNEYENILDANNFLTKQMNYITRFKELLKEIYQNYEILIRDKIKVPRKENEIRDILVDDYLSKNISNYTFEKEENNNLGRVDIFIQDTLTEDKPKFIIECKILDNKNTDGMEGLNAKYIKNGIQRFLTEHYFLENNFKINAMIGFVVSNLSITNNIVSINILTDKLLKNLVVVKQNIISESDNLYKSIYSTCNNKEFSIYHQMMDFSLNIKGNEETNKINENKCVGNSDKLKIN
ncbi:MAG: PD-(D/E)XK nuclease domain-containing protein [Campylobacterota bacterium]|nr:PD-(D/E)XK nuclease domain-containing protein [Campylobacterota bacterium]